MSLNLLRRGLVQPGNDAERHVEVHPKVTPTGAARKPAVIYVHGASGNALTTVGWLNNGRPHWTQDFTDAGYVCFGADLAGPQTWGNSTGTDMLGRLVDYTQTVPGVKPGPVVLYGQSMGGLNSLNWIGLSTANRAKVAALLLVVPVINLEDIRANNRPQEPGGYYAGLINGAYGGFYDDAVLGPTRNPQVIARSGKYAGLPILSYYGLTDITCMPGEMETFARTVGSNVELVPLPTGHETASYEAVDNLRLIRFLQERGL